MNSVASQKPTVAVADTPSEERSPVALTGHDSASPMPLAPRSLATAPSVQMQAVEPIDGPAPSLSAPVAPSIPQSQQVVEHQVPPNPIMILATRLCDGSLLQSDPQDIAAAVEQLNTLMAPLRARAALEIPKLCFCRPIAAPARFGMFEKLDENHRFRPGETVGVYMELRNFSSTPQGGNFAVCVHSIVEICDADGKVVFRFDAERTDSSLSPRQDYCNVSRFSLPALPPGAYTLWLKATDLPTGRSARRSLDFRLASSKS